MASATYAMIASGASTSASVTSGPSAGSRLLSLPAEIRLQIYREVFSLSSHLAWKQNRSWQDEMERDHGTHRWCNENPALRLESDAMSLTIDFLGLPFRRPVALLQTCQVIRREGTAVLYGRVGLTAQVPRCTLEDSSDCPARRLYHGLPLQQLLSHVTLEVDIRKGCYCCDRGIGRREFPVLAQYLFRKVKRVEVSVSFKNYGEFYSIGHKICSLTDMAYALDEYSTVESMSLSFLSDSEEFYRLGKQQQYEEDRDEYIRVWKCAAYRLSKRLPLTEARNRLWTAIRSTRPDISGVTRYLGKAEAILNSRIVRRSKKDRSGWVKVQYLVKWTSFRSPMWEDATLVLPCWREMVEEFHQKRPGKLKPAEITSVDQTQEGPTKPDVVSASKAPGSGKAEDPAAWEDVEHDEVFAAAMSKLAAKPATYAFEYV